MTGTEGEADTLLMMADTPQYANMVCTLLSKEGIAYETKMMTEQPIGSIFGQSCCVEIYVREQDYDRAVEVCEAAKEGVGKADVEEEARAAAECTGVCCPKCKSHNVKAIHLNSKVYFVVLFLGVIAFIVKRIVPFFKDMSFGVFFIFMVVAFIVATVIFTNNRRLFSCNECGEEFYVDDEEEGKERE